MVLGFGWWKILDMFHGEKIARRTTSTMKTTIGETATTTTTTTIKTTTSTITSTWTSTPIITTSSTTTTTTTTATTISTTTTHYHYHYYHYFLYYHCYYTATTYYSLLATCSFLLPTSAERKFALVEGLSHDLETVPDRFIIIWPESCWQKDSRGKGFAVQRLNKHNFCPSSVLASCYLLLYLFLATGYLLLAAYSLLAHYLCTTND